MPATMRLGFRLSSGACPSQKNSGGEDDLEVGIFGSYVLGVTNGNSGLDDYDGARVLLLDLVKMLSMLEVSK